MVKIFSVLIHPKLMLGIALLIWTEIIPSNVASETPESVISRRVSYCSMVLRAVQQVNMKARVDWQNRTPALSARVRKSMSRVSQNLLRKETRYLIDQHLNRQHITNEAARSIFQHFAAQDGLFNKTTSLNRSRNRLIGELNNKTTLPDFDPRLNPWKDHPILGAVISSSGGPHRRLDLQRLQELAPTLREILQAERALRGFGADRTLVLAGDIEVRASIVLGYLFQNQGMYGLMEMTEILEHPIEGSATNREVLSALQFLYQLENYYPGALSMSWRESMLAHTIPLLASPHLEVSTWALNVLLKARANALWIHQQEGKTNSSPHPLSHVQAIFGSTIETLAQKQKPSVSSAIAAAIYREIIFWNNLAEEYHDQLEAADSLLFDRNALHDPGKIVPLSILLLERGMLIETARGILQTTVMLHNTRAKVFRSAIFDLVSIKPNGIIAFDLQQVPVPSRDLKLIRCPQEINDDPEIINEVQRIPIVSELLSELDSTRP